MVAVKRRRGRWVVDWTKPDKKRGWKSFKDKPAADVFAAVKMRESGKSAPALDPRVTVAEYAARWLDSLTARHGSLVVYRSVLRRHVIPRVGTMRVVNLNRPKLRALLMESIKAGFKPNTVRGIHRVFMALCSSAVEDQLLMVNPADGLLRGLGIGKSKTAAEEVTAMTREERDRFLAVAAETEPGFYPILFCLSRAGLRIGEAQHLDWEDVACTEATLRVRGTFSRHRLGPTKTGRVRYVDMSAELAALLWKMRVEAPSEWIEPDRPVFTSATGCRIEYARYSRAQIRVRRAAGLPERFTGHVLRHTYARLLLEAGGDLLWLSRQMGHASIKLTADLYGKWAVIKRPGFVDVLDLRSSDVAEQAENGVAAPPTENHVDEL